jgi:hypothetical protein
VNLSGLAGLGVVLISAILLAVFSFLYRRSPFIFRKISAFTRLRQAVSFVVEDGTRLHISLGRGSLLTPFGAAALAGLAMLRKLGETTSLSDRPTIATSGDGLVSLAAQDTLRAALESVAPDQSFNITNSRFTGPTPFSYAAGAMPTIRDEQVATNVFIGNFGVEAALLVDAADRQGALVIAASDNLPAQAVLYAATTDPILGEELYAAGAYVQAGTFHASSLRVQDVMRWAIIAIIIGGALLKLVGIL